MSIHNHWIHGYVRILSCYSLFYFGEVINLVISKIKISKKINWIMPIVILLSTFALIIFSKNSIVNLDRNQFPNPIKFLIISLLGWITIYGISFMIEKVKFLKKFLR